MISHVREHILGCVVAFRVWWPHVSGKEAQDIPERHLVVVYLIVPLIKRHVSQILMRPCVTSDLMARLVHALDELRVACRIIVYLALSHVVARDEKGCFRIVFIQDVENLLSINIWSIIEGQSHVALVCAVVNACSSIAEVP
jgi:hypothetical protein